MPDRHAETKAVLAAMGAVADAAANVARDLTSEMDAALQAGDLDTAKTKLREIVEVLGISDEAQINAWLRRLEVKVKR